MIEKDEEYCKIIVERLKKKRPVNQYVT